MHGDIETVKVGGAWINRIQGTFADQEDAAVAGRHAARVLGVEWFARSSRTGRWFRRNTYDHDPRRTRG